MIFTKISKLIVLFSLVLFSCSARAQTSSNTNLAAIVKAQAETLAQLTLKKDFKGLVTHTYPKIVEMMGGAENMAKVLNEVMGGMEAKGMIVINVTVGEPSVVIAKGKELQCTVPRTLEMKVPNGRAVSKSFLIAISNDGGKYWYFIDASNKSPEDIKAFLPNLSENLVIPATEKPVFYKE